MGIKSFQGHSNNKKSRLFNLPYDTVSFKSASQQKLTGADLAYANLLEAPLEKFNSEKDFRAWASKELKSAIYLDQYKRDNELDEPLISILNEWKIYLTAENAVYKNNPALSLIIFRAVTSELSSYRPDLPPIFDPKVLAVSVKEFKQRLNDDTNKAPNFKKIYEKNLRLGENYVNTGTNDTKWVVIPSLKHDLKNFSKNVERVKALSYPTWLRRHDSTQYLLGGDVHIYLKDGQPKVALIFTGDRIKDIMGSGEDSRINLTDFEETNDYIKNNAFKCNDQASDSLKDLRKVKKKADKIKSRLKKAIENDDIKKIFNYFSIDISGTEEQGYTLSSFDQPDYYITFEDLGIDENKLLKNVCKIDGDANFRHCQAVGLSRLQHISGNARFKDSQVRYLNNLKFIGGYADCNDFQVLDLSNLEFIGESAFFGCGGQIDLRRLKHIGGDGLFGRSGIRDLSNLEYIGGDACFNCCGQIDLRRLKHIGRNAHLNRSAIRAEDLSNLEYIGGDIYLDRGYGQIDLRRLKHIGGDIIS